MKKISDHEFNLIEEQTNSLTEIAKAIESLSEEINAGINDLLASTLDDDGRTLLELVSLYNETTEERFNLVNEAHSTLVDYYDNRSDKWRDSWRGECFYSWHCDWESSLSSDPVELSTFDNFSIDGTFGIDIAIPELNELPPQELENYL